MAWDFTVDSDIQLDMAKYLKEKADELDTQFANLYTQIGPSNLGTHWVGSDYDAFNVGCEGYRQALSDMTDSVRMYAGHFEKVAEGTDLLSSLCISLVQDMTTRGDALPGSGGATTTGGTGTTGTGGNGTAGTGGNGTAGTGGNGTGQGNGTGGNGTSQGNGGNGTGQTGQGSGGNGTGTTGQGGTGVRGSSTGQSGSGNTGGTGTTGQGGSGNTGGTGATGQGNPYGFGTTYIPGATIVGQGGQNGQGGNGQTGQTGQSGNGQTGQTGQGGNGQTGQNTHGGRGGSLNNTHGGGSLTPGQSGNATQQQKPGYLEQLGQRYVDDFDDYTGDVSDTWSKADGLISGAYALAETGVETGLFITDTVINTVQTTNDMVQSGVNWLFDAGDSRSVDNGDYWNNIGKDYAENFDFSSCDNFAEGLGVAVCAIPRTAVDIGQTVVNIGTDAVELAGDAVSWVGDKVTDGITSIGNFIFG